MTNLEILVRSMDLTQLEELNHLNSKQLQLCRTMIDEWTDCIDEKEENGIDHAQDDKYLHTWMERHHQAWLDHITGINEIRRRYDINPILKYTYTPYYGREDYE